MSTTPEAVEMPVYDAAYYADYSGTVYEQSGEWLALFHHFADRIVSVLNPTSVLDAGCALGMLVQTLRSRGVEAYGVDISEYAIGAVDPSVAEFCRVASLTEPLDRTYDLITCIEVIEHLPAEEAEVAVANLCSATDRVLLSSTPYEHEEPTHLNVQPPEYWTALFARQGFFRNLDLQPTFVSPWAVLYERARPDLPEVVRAYDRSFWRQRDEINRMRDSLIKASQAAGETPSTVSAQLDATRAELDAVRAELTGRIAELDALVLEERHHRLRSVDEARAATHRMGTALGRVAELEAEVASMRSLAVRYDDVVNSTSWRLMWNLMAPYRQARARLGR